MLIRTATRNDHPDIVVIYNHAVDEKFSTADTEYVTVESRKEWFAQHSSETYPIYVAEENNKIWSISSVKPTGWKHLIPDEVALDGSQTGLVFTYRKALYRVKGSRTYFEGEFSPLHWVRKRDDRTFFLSTGINLRHANRSPAFSSYGMGVRAYKNYPGKDNLDNRVIYGVAFDVGLFADKYRITI